MYTRQKPTAPRGRDETAREVADRLADLTDEEYRRLAGILADALGQRRRDAEMSLLRAERFRPENGELVAQLQAEIDGYTRLGVAAGGMVRLLGWPGMAGALADALVLWARS